MPKIRKGAAAIEAAAENKGSGDFKPFAPSIRWTENGEEKYILVLTPIDETPVLNVHEFIQTGLRENGKPIFGFFASRRDPYFAEGYDQIEDEFGIKPSERTLGVAVELEPEYESSSSSRRPRVKRFKVATDTYDRKNEETGNTDEVTYPLVGIISQAAGNFYNHIRSHDADYGPIEELPLKVKRIGKGKDTQYSFTPFMDQEIDLSNLVDHIDGISYVSEDVRNKSQKLDLDAAAALIAQDILDNRIGELADKEAYDEAVEPLTEIKGYNKTFYRSNGDGPVDGPVSEDSDESNNEDSADDPIEEPESSEKNAAFKRIKQRAEAKAGKK